MAFVRKVYAILSSQILLTVAIVIGVLYGSFEVHSAGLSTTPTELGMWVLRNGMYVILISLIPILFLICALHGYKNRYPVNYLLLFTFTIFESLTLGFTCVFYFSQGYGEQILL